MNAPADPPLVPQHVVAGSGLRWWRESFTWLFGDVARLGVWVGMWLCFLLIHFLLHVFPLAGSLVSFLMNFVLSGGLMIAARKTEAGQPPLFADLFGGFGPQGGALVGAGLLVLAACAAVLGMMLLIGIGALISALASYFSSWSVDWQEPAAFSLRFGTGSLLLLLACLALLVPISMAAWLAPALVILRGASPVDSLRLSLHACWRNVGALSAYGIVFIGLALVATITVLGWILLGPLVFLSTYAAFRDMFSAPPRVEPGSA